MANSIIVSVPHNLGLEAAKKRVAERIEKMRRDYMDKVAQSEVNWSCDRADLRISAFGQTATAQVHVLADSLRIEVQLPFLLAVLSNKIHDVLTNNAKDALKLGPPKV